MNSYGPNRIVSKFTTHLSWLLLALMVFGPLLGLVPRVHAQTASSDFVTFPSAEVEFIVGPQLKANSALNPVPWFDQNALSKGVSHGEAFPADPPGGIPLSGTVTVTNASRTVVGVGTRFITDFPGAANNYYVLITDGTGARRSYILSSIQDDTHLTLSVAWQQGSASERPISNMTGDVADAYVNLNYYDQVLCQYGNYYRTGDARYLGYARKIADSWWRAPFILEGTRAVEESAAPRNIGMAGLMLRAMDGRPEMWPWLTQYVRTMFDIWVGIRVTYPGLYFGVRDPGYMLLHAANLARVHPNATVRQEFTEKVLNAAVNYYGRLQRTDGSWRWSDDAWIGDAMQPFHVGLLLEGMIAVHRLTGDTRVRASIIKGAEAIYLVGYNANGWRGSYYQVGGSWADGTNCANGCGAAALPFPPADKSLIQEARQLNSTSIHALGYAYFLTGDAKFKQWGDEMFDSTYSGTDGYRGLAWARAKEYDECYRTGGRYLVWRVGGSSPAPSPTPFVSPTPTPSPSATPTPTPTPTPTATPTPIPTPTPTPVPMTVTVTNPTTNSTFSFGSTVTVGATASHKNGGSISSVAFQANSQLIGTATTSPYSVAWSNMPAGIYSVTAVARDTQGVTTTSSPVTVKISKALKAIRNTRKNATSLEDPHSFSPNSAVQSSAQIDSLVSDLEQAYLDFHAERTMFSSARQLDNYLFASLFLARSSASLSKVPSQNDAVSDRVSKIDAYLRLCEDLMVEGVITNGARIAANQVKANLNLVITKPETRPLAGLLLMPDGLAQISASSVPFTTQTIQANSGNSYELGDISVSVKGQAAQLISISPGSITFLVPGGLGGGIVDVVVTSRGGFISYGTGSVSGLNPTILLNMENSSRGAVLDALNIHSGTFSTVTPAQYLGLDSRMRLSLLATGVSTGLANTDVTNDVWLSNGQMLANFAESVQVEARTSAGTTVKLPVEFAGSQGLVTGVDQVNVILPAQLAGAGSVQLTLVVGSMRSNPVTIVVQ